MAKEALCGEELAGRPGLVSASIHPGSFGFCTSVEAILYVGIRPWRLEEIFAIEDDQEVQGLQPE